MMQRLLQFLCDPVDKSSLSLKDPKYDQKGNIISGILISHFGRSYPIINGVPRFVEEDIKDTVGSFGDEWNYFNFNDFKINWLNHTVKNTFGSIDAFKGKVVVDAGGGSGMQSPWMSEARADYVICLELSNSVDYIVPRNLKGVENIDVVQCSIDAPPIKNNSINGIVMCHNVIQHTPSVEKTAHALWNIVGEGGEFVFNCYTKNDKGIIRKMRLRLYYFLRNFLSKRSFKFILTYSKIMAFLRFIPILGLLLEKAGFVVRGEIPQGKRYFKRAFKMAALNTYDCFGSHSFQHLKTDQEIKNIVKELHPKKVINFDSYFSRPTPIGCALRLFK